MQQHDPNDDPFAALSQETEQNAPALVSPMEFGMGLKNVKLASTTSPGSEEDPTEATHDETEHDADGLGDKVEEKATAATDETEKAGDAYTTADK